MQIDSSFVLPLRAVGVDAPLCFHRDRLDIRSTHSFEYRALTERGTRWITNAFLPSRAVGVDAPPSFSRHPCFSTEHRAHELRFRVI